MYCYYSSRVQGAVMIIVYCSYAEHVMSRRVWFCKHFVWPRFRHYCCTFCRGLETRHRDLSTAFSLSFSPTKCVGQCSPLQLAAGGTASSAPRMTRRKAPGCLAMSERRRVGAVLTGSRSRTIYFARGERWSGRRRSSPQLLSRRATSLSTKSL